MSASFSFTQFTNGTLAAVEVDAAVLRYLREHERDRWACSGECDVCRRYARCSVAQSIIEAALPKKLAPLSRRRSR